jgi:hypothetical protein
MRNEQRAGSSSRVAEEQTMLKTLFLGEDTGSNAEMKSVVEYETHRWVMLQRLGGRVKGIK